MMSTANVVLWLAQQHLTMLSEGFHLTARLIQSLVNVQAHTMEQ